VLYTFDLLRPGLPATQIQATGEDADQAQARVRTHLDSLDIRAVLEWNPNIDWLFAPTPLTGPYLPASATQPTGWGREADNIAARQAAAK
jgi:hypothetical protein